MARTALLSALAAAGLILPAATADAHPPFPVTYPSYPTPVYYPSRPVYHRPPPPVCTSYEVLYRTCAYEPWRCYATYDSSHRADRAAHNLRHRGLEVSVRVVG
jgi:hypothetical protein